MGLLSLLDILHDYVLLEEARLALHSAMHSMHNLVSAYYVQHPPPPHRPQALRDIYASPMIHYTQKSSSPHFCP